jgi:hypothetical protein
MNAITKIYFHIPAVHIPVLVGKKFPVTRDGEEIGIATIIGADKDLYEVEAEVWADDVIEKLKPFHLSAEVLGGNQVL